MNPIFPSRPDKRLLIFGVLAILLAGGFGGMLLVGKSSGAIPPHTPTPRPNGFDLYFAAAAAMTRPNPAVDENSDTKPRTPQEAAKIYTPARRAAWVAANAKTWDLMRQARAAQTQHPDNRANILANVRYGGLRDLARGKQVEAKHFKDIGRWDLALQSGTDTLEMGRDVEHGAPLIGSLVGMAMEAVGDASLDDVPSHLSAQAAKNGAARLEKIIAGGVSPAEVLSEEKWSFLTQARQNFSPKPNPNPLGRIITAPMSAPVSSMMDAFIAQSGKPLALQVTPTKPSGLLQSYTTILHPMLAKVGFNFARREMNESALLLRLALRAYRVENGAYPATLTQLAPKYLSKIPRDAFGRGEALRYRNLGDAYLVWSIGLDGKDDGGKPIPIKRGKKRVVVAPSSLGDVVVKP